MRVLGKLDNAIVAMVSTCLLVTGTTSQPACAKKSSFLMPAYDKITSSKQNSKELAPIGIPTDVSDAKQKTIAIPKGAGSINFPIQLLPDEKERIEARSALQQAEEQELTDLWEATLVKSPDIQFVVQKLTPTSNQGHQTTILQRMLSAALVAAVSTGGYFLPNGSQTLTSSAGNALLKLLTPDDLKNAKNAGISQTDIIMLYNMVRNTAEKVVASLRDYKKNLALMERTKGDLQDLAAMVASTRASQDESRQLEMEYTLRKQQRDILAIQSDVQKYRQQIVDYAGTDALCRLDLQIEAEFKDMNLCMPEVEFPYRQ